jgi:hypothetical protein
MAEALRILLPRITGEVSFRVYQHQGKQDLLARLADRLRGYRSWLQNNWRIVVIVDRDDDDCHELKSRLEEIATGALLTTRSAAAGTPWVVVNRIAIEELEAWYFGDWTAVRSAYPRLPATIPNREPYRRPDEIRGGTWESLERELQKVGYFSGGLRKIEVARAIATHMDPNRNCSPSFCAFRDVLVEMTSVR